MRSRLESADRQRARLPASRALHCVRLRIRPGQGSHCNTYGAALYWHGIWGGQLAARSLLSMGLSLCGFVKSLTLTTGKTQTRNGHPSMFGSPVAAKHRRLQEMIKLFITAIALTFSIAAIAGPKPQLISGWVSDDMCGAKGANAGHLACCKKCVAGGAKLVLVGDKDKRIYKIDNEKALK